MLLCARAQTAFEPPAEPAVMVSPVTVSPSWCDASIPPPQITPTSPTARNRASDVRVRIMDFRAPVGLGPRVIDHMIILVPRPISFIRGYERKRRGGFHGSYAS